MDPETLAHVFEPFFTTKERGHGTGLGLATVYGIVRQSGGYVVVDSAPSGGTRFEIYFPAVHAVIRRSPVPPAPPLPGGAGQTILVVEDEPGVRRLTVTVLRRAGYTVLEAADANEATALAHATGVSIDLLLTDVVLPGGSSGVALGRALKAQRPGLIVMHMSGYSAELASRGADADRAAFLGKPFTPASLLQAVHDALGAAQPPQVASPA
jgi:CheY-like chemotaxis protein